MNARQGFVEERTHAYRRVLARDADEQAENLTDWNQTYDQLTPGAFSGSLTEVRFKDIQLFRETTNQSVQESGSSWPGSRTFGVPLQMDGQASFCGQAMNRDMVLSLGGNEELDFRTARSTDVVGIAIGEPVFASFWHDMDATDPGERITGRHLIQGSAPKMAEFREFLQAVFDVLDERPEILGDAPVRGALRNSILGNLVWVLATSAIEPIASTAAQRRQLVEWAKAYTLDNVDEPVTVADLCLQLGVSRRHLQYCFQEVLDINPVQYLRAVRLNRVRRELKAGSRDGRLSVQDVAGRWGFWHLSHFASDYKKMFCELPSQTLSAALA
jgi:AraC family ethanolamine operon transcriptional activator